METKHSFIILNLIPYLNHFEGNTARVIFYQEKETVSLYLNYSETPLFRSPLYSNSRLFRIYLLLLIGFK